MIADLIVLAVLGILGAPWPVPRALRHYWPWRK